MSKKVLTIMHTNDTHSQIEEFAKRAKIINDKRVENQQENVKTLVVDAGDMIAGSIYYNLYGGKIEAKLLNMLKYDLITLGNHEFDNGTTGLAKFLSDLKVPVISSNINVDQDLILNQLKKQGHFQPSRIYEIDEVKVGFFALTTLQVLKSAEPSKTTIISDPLPKAKQMIANLKALGADLIICLSHLGFEEDQKLAKITTDLDVIIGGHSHTLLNEPKIVKNDDEKDVLILQANELGKHIGELNIFFSDNQFKYEYKMHKVSQASEDLEVKAVIDQVIAESETKTKQIIGTTLVNLDGRREVIRNSETNLGNLVADAYLASAKVLGYNVDFALINSGGIRKSITKGNILYKDIIDVLPFNKSLSIIEVSGQQLIESIENGLLLQVANLKVIFEKTGIKVFVKRNDKLELIDVKKNYLVATNNFVAKGHDNYIGFKQAKVIASNVKSDVEILIEFIQNQNQPFSYQKSNRIVKCNLEEIR